MWRRTTKKEPGFSLPDGRRRRRRRKNAERGVALFLLVFSCLSLCRYNWTLQGEVVVLSPSTTTAKTTIGDDEFPPPPPADVASKKKKILRNNTTTVAGSNKEEEEIKVGIASSSNSSSNSSNNNTKTATSTTNSNSTSTSTSTTSSSSSFCLLIKDDNEILSEWIAYHYHVFNMRRLIVAVDPDSVTSPLDVLRLWGRRQSRQSKQRPGAGGNGNTTTTDEKNNNNNDNNNFDDDDDFDDADIDFDLRYTVWNDEDYTPEWFHERRHENVPNKLRLMYPPPPPPKKTKTTKNATTNATTNATAAAADDENVPILYTLVNNHRYRQKRFYARCLTTIREEESSSNSDSSSSKNSNSSSDSSSSSSNDSDFSWTALIDTDEYLVPNPWVSEYIHGFGSSNSNSNQNHHHDGSNSSNNVTTTSSSTTTLNNGIVNNYTMDYFRELQHNDDGGGGSLDSLSLMSKLFPDRPSQGSLWSFLTDYNVMLNDNNNISSSSNGDDNDGRRSRVFVAPTYCVMMPRIQFGSKEDDDDDDDNNNDGENKTIAATATTETIAPTTNNTTKTTTTIVTTTSWNHSRFESLRWKFHQDFGYILPPKALVNVAKMDEGGSRSRRRWFGPLDVTASVHAPFSDGGVCDKLNAARGLSNWNQYRQPLAVYHYLGSLERYLSREDTRRTERRYRQLLKSQKADYAKGDENDPASKNKRNEQQQQNDGDDHRGNNKAVRWWIGGWLDDFVETHGPDKAYKVLGKQYASRTRTAVLPTSSS